MIDAEVVRLRRLRDAALRTRQYALALGSDAHERNSVFARTAVACWRIAGIATGRLNAHPHSSYQRGTSIVRIAHDRMLSFVTGCMARHRGSRLRTLAAQLRLVERELNDARALTWLLDLSDTLGRSQARLRRLMKEVEHGARQERGSHAPAAATELLTAARRDDADAVPGNWPYLAF